MSSETARQIARPDADYSARGLRFALIVGLGGMALIFLLATIDAVRLLGAMRTENKILRDAALQRTNHLASIRSSILLTHTYLGDYFLDSDQRNSRDYLAKVQAGVVALVVRSGELSLEHARRSRFWSNGSATCWISTGSASVAR